MASAEADPRTSFEKEPDHPLERSGIINELLKNLNTNAFAVGVFVGLLTLWFIFSRRRSGAGRRSILILGPCDSGKTVLFSQLLHKKPVDTYTSMGENLGEFKAVSGENSSSGRSLTLIDLPGQERLRLSFFDRFKTSARAVVYIIDASTIAKTLVDASEYLFRILSDPEIHNPRTPILIVCNKQDLPSSKSAALIERELAKEFQILRDTRTNGLLADQASVYLGQQGKDFQFRDLVNEVDFCETSIYGAESSGIDTVIEWISKV